MVNISFKMQIYIPSNTNGFIIFTRERERKWML